MPAVSLSTVLTNTAHDGVTELQMLAGWQPQYCTAQLQQQAATTAVAVTAICELRR
jgi:hypothetical protein